MGPGLVLDGEKRVLGVKRDAIDHAGDDAGEPAGRGLRDELSVIDPETALTQGLAAHAPLIAADPAAGGAELLALEVGRGLDAFADRVALRHPGRDSPNLNRVRAAPDGDIGDIGDGGALGDRRQSRRRLAAVELDDAGIDAMPG